MKKIKAFAGFITTLYAYSTIPFFAYFVYDTIITTPSVSLFSPLWLPAFCKAIAWPMFI